MEGPSDLLRTLAELTGQQRLDEAEALSCQALAAFPADPRLQRARVVLLRRTAQPAKAIALLTEVLQASPSTAWAHAQMGVMFANTDRPRAIYHYRQALDLEPNPDVTMALIQALERRTGDTGGETLEEAYQLLRPLLPNAPRWPASYLHIAFTVLSRICAFDELEALGDPMTIGRQWAEDGDHTGLFLLLSHTRTDVDRAELLVLHQIAAQPMIDRAERDPI